ncbi:MAG: large subunit ribosomal protein [Solirubrobacteraceae bacterium]|jgi:large subunit ribosomal protein L29|nr:large subunit ribosomal protein [Solirubrobacteraceae bacterium]MEA2185926.1 large subunit ribosomal protein [Solirubrobacteraceae bacterium]
MNAKDLRDLSDKQLAEHIATSRKDLFGLRFQHATGELQNTAGMRAAKRELARALTIQRERERTLTPNLSK